MGYYKTIWILIFIGIIISKAEGGILSAIAGYGVCQTGCNGGWVMCVAAAGGIAGVSTGGVAVAPAILACNVLQGICMAACAGMTLIAPTP